MQPPRNHPTARPDHDADMTFDMTLMNWMNGAASIMLLDVAHRSGLLEQLHRAPGTSEEVSRLAGLSERHVRELLGGLVATEVVRYDPLDRRYTLPDEHAACLVGDSPQNLSSWATAFSYLAGFAPDVVATVQRGGGIPYARYQPAFVDLMDSLHRKMYDAALLSAYVPAVPGLADRLRDGALVGDIGCGSGHVANLLAAAFPESEFVGIDLNPQATAAGQCEAAQAGLTNVSYLVADATELPDDRPFDVLFAFDVIHDLPKPAAALARARHALAGGGQLVMVENGMPSALEQNIGDPMSAIGFTSSLFHCVQVSVAEGGEGLGCCWGREAAGAMLRQSGFSDVTTHDIVGGVPGHVAFVGSR